MDKKLKVLMIGAHPDDCDICGGGLAIKYVAAGHEVRFLSVCNGCGGHHEMKPKEIAERRYGESRAVAALLGITYDVWDIPDCEVMADLETRKKLINYIREFNPDIIFTHRTNDYHPDHRACGQLVMDCAYMVRVPLFCPDTPCPAYEPAILSVWDGFTRPLPFVPDLVVPIDPFVEQKMDGCLCHESQFYEWLPHINGWTEIQAAQTREEKTRMLKEILYDRFAQEAKMYPQQLPEGTQYAESFQWNEYGAPLSDELRRVMTE